MPTMNAKAVHRPPSTVHRLVCPAPRAPRPSPQLGFTLFEVLIVAAIFGGIMGALLISFLVSRSSYLSADAYIQVQQEARRAFDNMVKELREAGWDPTKADANGPPNTIVAVAGPPTQIDFQIALGYDLDLTVAGCLDAQVCWGAQDQSSTPQSGWSLRYCISSNGTDCDVNGTRLIRQILNGFGALQGTPRVLANNVDTSNAADGLPATQFSYTGSPDMIVNIRLAIRTTSQQLPGGSMATSPAPLKTRVKLRNP